MMIYLVHSFPNNVHWQALNKEIAKFLRTHAKLEIGTHEVVYGKYNVTYTYGPYPASLNGDECAIWVNKVGAMD
ncbi:hypothetical protein D3C78_19590 [compost metagenome]